MGSLVIMLIKSHKRHEGKNLPTIIPGLGEFRFDNEGEIFILKLSGVLGSLREVAAFDADKSRPLCGKTHGWKQQTTTCEKQDRVTKSEDGAEILQDTHEEISDNQGPLLLFHLSFCMVRASALLPCSLEGIPIKGSITQATPKPIIFPQ